MVKRLNHVGRLGVIVAFIVLGASALTGVASYRYARFMDARAVQAANVSNDTQLGFVGALVLAAGDSAPIRTVHALSQIAIRFPKVYYRLEFRQPDGRLLLDPWSSPIHINGQMDGACLDAPIGSDGERRKSWITLGPEPFAIACRVMPGRFPGDPWVHVFMGQRLDSTAPLLAEAAMSIAVAQILVLLGLAVFFDRLYVRRLRQVGRPLQFLAPSVDVDAAHADEFKPIEGLMQAAAERIAHTRAISTAMAHDFKGRLTRIITSTQAAYAAAPAPVQTRLRGALDNLARINAEFEGILDLLLRLGPEQALQTPTIVDIRLLVEECVAAYQDLFDDRGVAVNIDIAPNLAMASLTRGFAVERAMGNLIENAAKYTPVGGKVSICGIQPAPGRFELTLQNTDPSQDPVESLGVFGVRGESSVGSQGTGLGLSVVANFLAADRLSMFTRRDKGAFEAVIAGPAVDIMTIG